MTGHSVIPDEQLLPVIARCSSVTGIGYIRTMRNFALESGTVLAQFTFYHPYPGTKDFHEFTSDIKNLAKVNFTPKHKSKMLDERFWLKAINENDVMVHPNIAKTDLKIENKKCWDQFYSIRESRLNELSGAGSRKSGRFPRKSLTSCCASHSEEFMADRGCRPTAFKPENLVCSPKRL